MQSKYKLRRGELYSQVYTTGFHWCQAHPMKLKSDAHNSLSLLFQRDGVPPKMIMDGSKEQTLGGFKRNARMLIVASSKLNLTLRGRMLPRVPSEN
jgi:hypothetical protein